MTDQLAATRTPGPHVPPRRSAGEEDFPGPQYSTTIFGINTITDMPLWGFIPGLDALLASLRTCEAAAEATRAVGERCITEACAQGLLQITAGPAAVTATEVIGGLTANPGQTTLSHIGMKSAHLTRVDEQVAGETLSLRTSVAALDEASVLRPKRRARETNEANQDREYSSSNLNALLGSLDIRNSTPIGTSQVASIGTASKRRKGNEISSTEAFTRTVTTASLALEDAPTFRRTASAAAFADSVMGPPAALPTENALGGLRALNRRQGAAKQSRMSRRLECFRREAEEALRGQHNATVMSIFSAIDSHIRSFRGGSMSPSELDLRIMTVIDRCLPLEGAEARAVEAVLDMGTVRRLKASLEGRPRNSGGFLDLIALSKLCRHIPGVCFDKWNLGWIATWREHRRPVHKHFSAKKYGFFRAREFAICYRSKMTSDVTLEGADPPTSPRSIIAQGDLSPLLARSTEMLSKMAQHQTGHGGTALPNGEAGARGATGAATGALRRSHRGALTNGSETPEERASRTGVGAPEEKACVALERRRTGASTAATAHRADIAATDSAQQLRVDYASQGAGAQLPADAFLSRDGWAALVARTPRVERVSFDFTNQSWIAQWKQHGRTTYRRFAVSKYGFATAHKLAVEYKSKYFKETPSPFASLEGTAQCSNDNANEASEAGLADTGEAGQAHQQQQQQRVAVARASRFTRARCPPRRQHELAMGDNANLDADGGNKPWPQTVEQRFSDMQQQQQREGTEHSRSGARRSATFSDTRRQHPQPAEGHQKTLLENIARNSAVPMKPTEALPTPSSGHSLSLANAVSSTPGPIGTVSGVEALEALLCSAHEVRELIGCLSATETPVAGRGLDGACTTATPTSHTHLSGESFPINTSRSPLQQRPPSETGTTSTDTSESQAQGTQQGLQRMVLRLMQQTSPPPQSEGSQQQAEQLQQPNDLFLASGTADGTVRPQINQREATVQGVDMLRTALKCMLRDLLAKCTSDVDSCGGKRQVYMDLIEYHLRYVEETEEVEDLKPYSQLFAPSLHGKLLPSTLSAAVRTHFLQNLENLFVQHQQQIVHQEQLTRFLVMQAQHQRELHQEQQQATAQQY